MGGWGDKANNKETQRFVVLFSSFNFTILVNVQLLDHGNILESVVGKDQNFISKKKTEFILVSGSSKNNFSCWCVEWENCAQNSKFQQKRPSTKTIVDNLRKKFYRNFPEHIDHS